MRYQSPTPPANHLVRRVAQGASTEEMMRRGEIAGQALGLLQMVAAHTNAAHTNIDASPIHDRPSPRPHPAEAN